MKPNDILYHSKYIRAKDELYDYKCKTYLVFAFVALLLITIYLRSHKPLEAKSEMIASTAIHLVEIPTDKSLPPKPPKPPKPLKSLTANKPIEAVKKPFSSPYSSNKKSDKEKGLDWSLNNEGGYNPRDSNGYPVKYGINQEFYKPLPGYPRRVKDLTLSQARHYLGSKYYDPGWDSRGYNARYKAFLLDSSIQHGYTVRRIENCGKGDINKAVNCRLNHLRNWCNRNRTQCSYKEQLAMENRIKKYRST